MIKNRDIIVVGLQPWDIEIGSNCKNVAIEFSKHNRILYVNPPMDLNTRIVHSKRPYIRKRLDIIKSGNNLLQVAPNIWNLFPKDIIYSINWLPGQSIFDFFNLSNNKKFAKNISEAVAKLGFSDFILFNDCDMLRSFYLQELLQPSLSIYYFRDHLMAVQYWYKHGHVFEPQLMKKSSLVCVNSEYLLNIAKKNNPHSFNVGSGCDLTLFNPDKPVSVPPDMVNITGPIIGYIGAIISYRLDLEMLIGLCRKRREWSFVFIGMADKDFSNSELMDLPNCHFLGLKQESELPDYLSLFDVAMNPQKLNQMTIGNYPRKIDEYLSMGKATVATDTIFMQELFKDYVYLGQSVDDFERLIFKALSEDNEDLRRKRVLFAQTHSWENHVNTIYNAIESLRPDWTSAS
ncbi:MAG TPA: glycosyltransferase [Puia sp.]|nr:glycosyltransferase [Puia sp.]